MKSTYAFVFSVLVAASPAWAGSAGNGAAQRAQAYGNPPPPPPPRASYAYCFGGDPRVTYFSGVFPIPPAGYGGGVAFGHYLTQRGYHNNGGQCRSALTEAGAVADRKSAEASISATYQNHKIVETEWSGT